jgi:hypothetical protein
VSEYIGAPSSGGAVSLTTIDIKQSGCKGSEAVAGPPSRSRSVSTGSRGPCDGWKETRGLIIKSKALVSWVEGS